VISRRSSRPPSHGPPGQGVINSFFLPSPCRGASGRLGDYYAIARLIVALLVFALGSLSAAVSSGFIWLVVSIAVAGAGAATLYPFPRALVANVSRSRPRTRDRPVTRRSASRSSSSARARRRATEAIDCGAISSSRSSCRRVALLGRSRSAGAPESRALRHPGLAALLVGLTATLVALMQALVWAGTPPRRSRSLPPGSPSWLASRSIVNKDNPPLDTSLLGRRAFRA